MANSAIASSHRVSSDPWNGSRNTIAEKTQAADRATQRIAIDDANEWPGHSAAKPPITSSPKTNRQIVAIERRLRCGRRVRRIGRSSLGVVEAKCPSLVIVAEQLGVAPPIDGSPQGSFGVDAVQVVLKLEVEAGPGRMVLLPFVEHMADMGRERHEPDQMLSEEPLALLGAALREKRAPPRLA